MLDDISTRQDWFLKHSNMERCLKNLELLNQPLDQKLNDFDRESRTSTRSTNGPTGNTTTPTTNKHANQPTNLTNTQTTNQPTNQRPNSTANNTTQRNTTQRSTTTTHPFGTLWRLRGASGCLDRERLRPSLSTRLCFSLK